MKEKKPRDTILRVDFGRAQTITGISAPNEDGLIVFYDESGLPVAPKTIEVDSAYGRRKGLKVVSRISANAYDIRTDQNSNLLRYKHLFAVDTNSREINSVPTAITVVSCVTDIRIVKPHWHASLVRQNAFEFQDALESPEKIGWCEATALIAKHVIDGPVGLIVDAHLDELGSINSRKQAICRGYHLPDNFELIYASSDVGRVDCIANAAIAHCDKIASLLLTVSQKVPAMFFKRSAPDSPYSRFRVWEPPIDSTENWTIKIAE